MKPGSAFLVLLGVAVVAGQVQPSPQPDDTAETFVLRWNEWADATDPDRSDMAALQRAVDDAHEAMRQIPSKHGESAARWAIQSPFHHPDNWPLALKAAEAIAPHCHRIRARLATPVLAFGYEPPVQAEPVEPDDRRNFSFAEVLNASTEQSRPLSSAMFLLRTQSDMAKHTGNIGLVTENTLATLHAARHVGRLTDVMSQFSTVADESSAISDMKWLLSQPQSLGNDQLLERLQSGLHAIHQTDHSWLRALRTRRLADEGVLLESFDPNAPGFLTPRGRLRFQTYFDIMSSDLFEQRDRFMIPNPPPTDSQFAPRDEQLAVYRTIMDALLQDLEGMREQGAEQLRSVEAFRAVLARDDAARFAPALAMFNLDENYLSLEIRGEAERRAMLVVLAIYRYHARHNGWPARLDTIDQDLLPIDPIDPYSGELFGYAVRDGVPVVWSQGPDRDDDDGRPAEHIENETHHRLRNVWFSRNEWAELSEDDKARYDGDILHFPMQ